MKSRKETILNMYFLEHLKPVDIAKELNVSKSAVTQVLQKDDRYSEEKERRKAENYRKHIRYTEERNTRVRKEQQFKNSVDELVLKNMHKQAGLELSAPKKLNNMAYRNWNKSAYVYNERRKGFEFRKELGRSNDVPKFIKVEVWIMQEQERKYTYEEVTAYAVLGIFEFLNNQDMVSMPLHRMVIIMDDLEEKYSKDIIVDFACKLIQAERNS